ncbi:beta-soluble NSF attachment protein [Aureococcus anophagefferens]|uniref:Beta-soluble NSF attachment protein n=1 Tax=Aureococcus anophagefferens TaxID=44056 RepID=A0ABR1G8V1_AURAN
MAKGEKALTKFSFFGGGTAKFEDAAECFNDAGKQFVMGKAYGEGASAYRRAADCHLKAKSEFDAASSHGKAGEAFQKLRGRLGLQRLLPRGRGDLRGHGQVLHGGEHVEEARGGARERRRPGGAAERHRGLGAAIDYYDGENQPMRANGCREKVAFLSATLGAYDDALAAFDSLGRSCLGSNLGKFNAKKWFTNAILCALAREDVVKAKNALAEYANLDYSFVGTREHMLCEQLTARVGRRARRASRRRRRSTTRSSASTPG